ncbi:MAG: aminoacyl-tRNA deacylase [Endomicrobiales bacterium]
MPIKQLIDFLNKNKVKYVILSHSPAYTSQEVAASTHITGKKMAKTIIVEMDGKLAMVVLPANEKIQFDRLQQATGARQAGLAPEDEFKGRFPSVEPGAMPPFGNLYDLEVYVSPDLKGGDIAFNAGNYSEVIVMPYADFERLVRPKVLDFAAQYQGLESR